MLTNKLILKVLFALKILNTLNLIKERYLIQAML